VEAGLIIRDEVSRPAIALVEIDHRTAARTVFIQMDNYGYLKPEDIPGAEISLAKALLVDSYELDASESALEAAAGSRCRSILDFESGDQGRLKKLLGLGTYPILPLAAARNLTGMRQPDDVLRALGDLCPGQVVATDGVHGSWALDRDSCGIIHQPAFVVEPKDTTGCGDAFHAGYIVGLLEGWPLNLRMEFGSLLASRVAGRVGGRTALPWRKDAPSMIRGDISSNLHRRLSTMS